MRSSNIYTSFVTETNRLLIAGAFATIRLGIKQGRNSIMKERWWKKESNRRSNNYDKISVGSRDCDQMSLGITNLLNL
jgi:hypothetical protein